LNPPGLNHGFVRCTNCGYPQSGDSSNRADFSVCPHCNSRLRISVFPALFAQTRALEYHEPAGEETATCFYHPTRAAVVPCGSCGRYLCALCEIELGEETICPNCMDSAARNEEVKELIDSRTLYDSIALALAVFPVLFWFVTVITAPLSIYITVRHWRSPMSILPRSKVRFVLAFIIAGIQVSLWSALLFAVLT